MQRPWNTSAVILANLRAMSGVRSNLIPIQRLSHSLLALCLWLVSTPLHAALTIETFDGKAPTESLSPLKVVAKFTDYRPVDYPITSHNGRLFFSQYDKSGNNFDIVALDIANQSSEYILRGRPGGQFVAQSDKYLVVSEKGRFANPLVVIDKTTGERVKQIKLRLGISWAKIEGNRLIAIQGSRLGSGYASKAPALVFELPSLKIIKSIEIVGGNDVQLWDGKILSLGYELAAYDDEFNELFKISLPKRKAGDGVSCAATWPLHVYGEKAVIVANCGEILIYDLQTRQLEHTVPSYAHFYSVAILNGLIFTTPTSEPRQKDNAHVYDLYTGKELAVLPINMTDLFAKGDRLLAVEREFAKHSLMTLYSVDVSVLRNGQWRAEQVLKKCQKAGELLVSSGNLYGAIELCKSAGIEGLVGEVKNSNSLLPVIKQYALWLSKTFDRGRTAISILEKLQKISPDQEINSALAEVRLKTRVLEGRELGPMTAEERQTDFASVLGSGSQLVRTVTKNIEFGAFSNLFHFSEDRIYVGRYGCRRCPDDGASIGVLDRNTFEEVANIPIAPDDPEYQDNITSIATDKNRIYVSVNYRYEQAGRPNFFVIEKRSLKVVRKEKLESVFSLITDGNKLLACGCHFSDDQSCKILDPISLKTESAPGRVCIQNEPDSNSVVSFEVPIDSRPHFVAATKDYLVARTSRSRDTPYAFYPKTGGQPMMVQDGLGDSLSWPVSVDDNLIVVGDVTGKGMQVVNARTGSSQALFSVPINRSRVPVAMLYKRLLFFGLGRDLIIFDVKNNRLKRYIKDFIPAAFKDNGHGLDMNRIDRLIIDQGRLIAITFYGENSQIVQLADLEME